MVYIKNETAYILDLFDDLLVDHGIKIPSPEDEERGEDNAAALYGTVYSDLFDQIEERLTDLVEHAQSGDVIEYEWG